MEDQIFGFNMPIYRSVETEHLCPACGGPTTEVYATKPGFPQGFTGIYRCLADSCDCYSVPTMPEIHA